MKPRRPTALGYLLPAHALPEFFDANHLSTLAPYLARRRKIQSGIHYIRKCSKSDAPPPDASREYRPIADYGVIGDMHTAALIASDGSIDWACLPYFDSPAVFGRLLDRRTGGYCAIRVPDDAKSSRIYIEGTNILETTFTTPSGTVAVADFMPVQAHRAPEERNPRIIRLARCTSGHVDIAFECKPGLGFQGSSARFQALTAGIIEVKIEAQDLLMEGPDLSVRRDTVLAKANLHAGETAFFAISVASQAAQGEFLDIDSASSKRLSSFIFRNPTAPPEPLYSTTSAT